MSCQRCNSQRVATVSSKASDMHHVSFGEHELNDYLPCDIGIGGGDYVRFSWCFDCGQIQGTWPLPLTETFEQGEE